jgi:hypothetical protein
MAIATDLHVLHAAGADEVDPRFHGAVGEEVLEAAAIELVARDGRVLVGAALDARREVTVVARGEPEAEPALVDLVLLEVVLEAEHPAEVVTGDLLGRLADLEGGLRRGAIALLGDEDARVGTRLLDLQPEGQPGQAAAEDRHVVAVGRPLVVAHVALSYRIGRVTGRGDPNPVASARKTRREHR